MPEDLVFLKIFIGYMSKYLVSLVITDFIYNLNFILMKNYLIIGFLFLGFFNSLAQEKTMKDTTKAYVYFFTIYNPVREYSVLKFFDGEKYLGKMNGMVFHEYVCDPGIHKFWVESTSFSVLEADLLGGHIYVIALSFKGVMQIDLLIPIHKDLKAIKKKKPSLNKYFDGCRQIYFSDKEIEKGLNENNESIKRAMRYFRVMHLHEKEIPTLTSDMYFKKMLN